MFQKWMSRGKCKGRLRWLKGQWSQDGSPKNAGLFQEKEAMGTCDFIKEAIAKGGEEIP